MGREEDEQVAILSWTRDAPERMPEGDMEIGVGDASKALCYEDVGALKTSVAVFDLLLTMNSADGNLLQSSRSRNKSRLEDVALINCFDGSVIFLAFAGSSFSPSG